jgi:hypothetical protein
VRPAKGQPLRPAAPPLPEPDAAAVTVRTAAELYAAVGRARAGATVLLADGRYVLTGPLALRTDRLTLRGASGDRTKVVLDGAGRLTEAISLFGCSDVTIADLTVCDVRWNGIKLSAETGVQRVRIHNCVFRNIWQRAVKGTELPTTGGERPRGWRIEHCLFVNDRPKRYGDDPQDTDGTFGGDYIAGIDLMYATECVIRDNVFRGINGRTGQGRGAVFLWHDSRDCVVERNVIVDCDAGVSLGNAAHAPGAPPHCTRCVVRNNCVTRAPEGGVAALHTKDCKILHNTVCDTTGRAVRGVRAELGAEGLVVANNLLAGPKVLIATKDRVEARDNCAGAAAGAFVDAGAGDLHLAEPVRAAARAGRALPDVRRDLDGRRRGDRPDLGAHEFSPD